MPFRLMHSSNTDIKAINTEYPHEDKLAAITEEHPYYSLAQFRLLLSHKKNQHKNFEKQVSVASLFFTNQRWFKWQLSYQTNIKKGTDDKVALVSLARDPGKPLEPETAPANQNEELITFEPLYTIDYFASQGIKISEETLTLDKLGTQLKSFTEWLKSMKKIHPDKLPDGDAQTDKTIQEIAESSNTNINVVTEAMAEVLLTQGKIEQAIDIYNKLSLNNPSGRAYFTAKINSLKPV